MSSTIIIVTCLLLTVVLIACFCYKNKAIQKLQISKVGELKGQIELHKQQIYIRNKNLNKYDFLKYNLKDSLYVQNNIQLNL